jgi:K+-sensing histidine kinase KdpD
VSFEFSRLIRWGQKTAAEPSVTWRYGFAVLAVLAATGLRHAFNPVLSTQAPYISFTFAVIVAALFGGRLPGLTAAALSGLLVDWFFLKPPRSLSILSQEAFWDWRSS